MPSTVLKRRGLGFIIVLMVLVSLLFLIVPYAVGVGSSRVYPAFPFISDLGEFRSESSAFTLLLSISSLLGLVVCYLRFHQVYDAYKSDQRTRRLNYWSFVVACLSVLGALLVASFQGSQGFVHGLGAFMVFGFGWVYQILMSIVSWRTSISSKRLVRLRITMTILSFISIIGVLLFAYLSSKKKPKGCNVTMVNGEPWGGDWQPCLPGWGLRVTAAVFEWVLGILLIAFFSSFYHDFALMKLVIHVLPNKEPEQAAPPPLAQATDVIELQESTVMV